MKTKSILIALLIWLLIFSATTLRGSNPDIKGMIVHADSIIMNRETSRGSLKGALIEILDAALFILPKTAPNAECRSRIEVAKTEINENSMFSEKGRQYLALALFTWSGVGARALTLGFGMTGLISVLAGFIQAIFGFVHPDIRQVGSAIIFIISSGSLALLGMLIAAASLEDREVMEGRRERMDFSSRMFWIVFPLVTFLFLILSFLAIITPMTKPG